MAVYILRLLHAMNQDNPHRRVQFCELFQHKVHEDEKFMSRTVWFAEATFKLNGTVNHHNYVYWAPENPYIYVDNLPGLKCLV